MLAFFLRLFVKVVHGRCAPLGLGRVRPALWLWCCRLLSRRGLTC